ncbi:unnamed protein product [Candidula unifasciata]|uniref:HIT-type domain-containing protein n=1 Tax=Candidula unifasciata TaxID=100452 RepID=A0A8S3YJP5_9EUPU|nr:unnamed protein product [Candidula unifasciata]
MLEWGGCNVFGSCISCIWAVSKRDRGSRYNKCPAVACEVCDLSPSKYTCPGCRIRTCSAQCVKEHKAKLNCTGERDKTAFVDLQDYSDMHLLNDYRFLEDAERRLYSNKTAPENRRRAAPSASLHLNKRSKFLITAALKRGVKLKMVSPALTKNKINTSFYTISSDTIAWHIEWHFVATNTVINDEKIPETTRLVEAARKHTNFVQYPHLRKSLEDYKKDRLDKCRFLLKVDGLPANRERFIFLFFLRTVQSLCFICLFTEDMMVMNKENASHLSVYHPELNLQTAIEETLLNPKSSVYSTTEDSVIHI